MHNLLEKLNERQKKAVLATDGPLLVIAGAGSGKTLVLTHKIAYLILEKGVRPEEILAVTFTNKAAREMKERLERLLKARGGAGDARRVVLGTFHAFCLTILRAHAEKLGLTERFVIFDEKDQLALIKAACDELAIDQKRFAPELFSWAISKHKSKLTLPAALDETAQDPFSAAVRLVYETYQRALLAHNAVDFDDMIMLAVLLLEQHETVRAHYQNAYRYLLIDEYQDTNYAQYRLARLLAQEHNNICAVGDMDQAIYGWRAADVTNILNFEKDYENTRVVLLEENYRSTGNILSAANTIIAKNKMRREKNLFTKNGEGTKIHVILARTETDEAEFVSRTIARAVRKQENTYADFAVLYRTNAQSRAVEEAFMHARIPYVVLGGLKFYARKEVKDMLSYLRFIANPKDKTSLSRIVSVPARGIGKVALERFIERGEATAAMQKFLALAEMLRGDLAQMPLSQFVKHVGVKTGLRDHFVQAGKEGLSRWENVLELISVAGRYDNVPATEALTRLLDNVALASAEDEDAAHNAVRLMTVHSAKGLEFTSVFVVGMEDNVFPHSRAKHEPAELEEERRLCYVAVTRAKKQLWLSAAQSRMLFGQLQANPPSRFLFDIPEHLVSFASASGVPSLDISEFEDGIIDIE